MFFDINGGEFLVILLVAVIVIGPTRLPRYAEQLAKLTKQARRYIQDARTRVDAELGDEARDIDWESLDPRKYDPRRIVRDALLDTDPPARPAGARPAHRTSAAGAATAAGAGAVARAASDASPLAVTSTAVVPDAPVTTPFDDEAT